MNSFRCGDKLIFCIVMAMDNPDNPSCKFFDWSIYTEQIHIKLFSIAASRIRAIQENRHRAVLVPVPASTREKHRTRYEAFCRKLSADMGVADGYGAITVAYDRAQYKGTHGNGDRTANLEFHPERFRGKCVLLVDDVLTTGATFIALRRKLIAHGAKFVIGMFLAKTIAFEDERKAEEGG